jgi:hypothetical protein
MVECPENQMRVRRQFAAYAAPAVVLVSLLAMTAVSAPAADPATMARAIQLSGRVSVERSGGLWAVSGNGEIQPGETIVTGFDGYALFQLDDGSKFEVFPESKVIFRANRGNWRDLLDIYLGKVKVEIQKLGGRPNPYRVNSPTALIAVRGTVFEVSVASDETTTVAVEEGFVSVSHKLHPGEVLLKPGDVLIVHPAEPLVPAGAGRARAAARIIGWVVDRALETVRVGGPGSSRVPSPGGSPAPGGNPSPGTLPGSSGGDMGQAPGPPKNQGGDDSGSGSGSPVSTSPLPTAPPSAQPPVTTPAPTTPAPSAPGKQPQPGPTTKRGTRAR